MQNTAQKFGAGIHARTNRAIAPVTSRYNPQTKLNGNIRILAAERIVNSYSIWKPKRILEVDFRFSFWRSRGGERMAEKYTGVHGPFQFTANLHCKWKSENCSKGWHHFMHHTQSKLINFAYGSSRAMEHMDL